MEHAANGTGTAYAEGATFPFTASTTLYAQWSAVAVVKISEAATFPVNTEVVGGNTLTINPQKVGGLIVFDSEIHSHTVTVDRGELSRDRHMALGQALPRHRERRDHRRDLVGGRDGHGLHQDHRHVFSQHRRAQPRTGERFLRHVESVHLELRRRQRRRGVLDHVDSPIPPCTSGPASTQVYWGYVESTATALAGATPGFTYAPTAEGNSHHLERVALAQYPLRPPRPLETPVSNNTSVAAILRGDAGGDGLHGHLQRQRLHQWNDGQ